MIHDYFGTSVNCAFGNENGIDAFDVTIDFNILIGVDDESGSFGIVSELFIWANEIGGDGDIFGADNFSSAFRDSGAGRGDSEISGRTIVVNAGFLRGD